MAKVKYDVSKVEGRKVPKPGVYEASISGMTHGDSSNGNPMFTIEFRFEKGEYKGQKVWYYILTDGSQEMRMREFTDALGLPPKGTIDTDALVGTLVQLRTDIDPAKDGYDEKARVKNVLSANGASATATADEEGEEEAEDYEEWDLADLKEEAAERGIKVTGRVSKAKLVAALTEADEAEEAEEEEGEEEEAESEEEELTIEDLEEMSRSELKQLIADEELDIKVLKRTTDDQLREKIAEALELEAEEDGEEEEGEEEDEAEDKDYASWDIADLKAELKERGLKTDGRKSVLVGRLQKDDENDSDPF